MAHSPMEGERCCAECWMFLTVLLMLLMSGMCLSYGVLSLFMSRCVLRYGSRRGGLCPVVCPEEEDYGLF